MGVLDGIKVLELARVAPAELPGMFFADMGADVLKIETPPEHGEDDEASGGPPRLCQPQQAVARAEHEGPRGTGALREAGRHADIIIEGFRPGVMKRLGADYEASTRSIRASSTARCRLRPERPLPRLSRPRRQLPVAGRRPGSSARPTASPCSPEHRRRLRGREHARRPRHHVRAVRARADGRGQHVDVSYLDTSVALLAATPNMRYF